MKKSLPIVKSEINDCSQIEPLATVLVVDDRESDIDLIKALLIERNHLQCHLSSARSAEEALGLLQSGESIDLILLDINMPDMDGFELLEQMGKCNMLEYTTVIMCSGSTYEKDKERARKLGAIGYLVKPLMLHQLQPIVERIATVKLVREGEYYRMVRVRH